MEFRKLTTADKPLIDGYLKDSNCLGSDYSYGSWFSWYDYESMQIAEENGALFLRADMGGERVYLPPLTSGDFAAAVERIKHFSFQEGEPFKMVFATEEQVKTLENYIITPNRDNSEYVYRSEDLINLSGKKYHGKRNHIAKFDSLYTYKFCDYDDTLYGGVSDLINLWIAEKGGFDDDEEKLAFFKMLNLRKELNCFADVIIIDGRVVGVSIGEVNAAGVGITLFEKADYNYEGIYTALNRLVAAKHYSGVEYVNRQEDMGIEGLRTAKLSYHPALLVDKYTVTPSEEEQLRNLYATSFLDSDAYISHFFDKKAPNSTIVCERKDGVIVSAAYCFDRGLIVNGAYIRAAMLTAAATLSRYRKQGYLRKLLRRVLCELYSRGASIVLLQPFMSGFYRRFGFFDVSDEVSVTCEYTAKRPLKCLPASAGVLKEAYDNYTYGLDYFVNRTESDFAARLEELHADCGEAYAVYKAKKPVGYFMLTDGVEEMVLDEKYRGAVKLLDGKVFKEGGAELRVVNVYRLVEQLRFKHDFELKFKLTDDMVASNGGVFCLTVSGGCGRLDVCADYEKEFTAAELTKWLLLTAAGGENGFIVDRY